MSSKKQPEEDVHDTSHELQVGSTPNGEFFLVSARIYEALLKYHDY